MLELENDSNFSFDFLQNIFLSLRDRRFVRSPVGWALEPNPRASREPKSCCSVIIPVLWEASGAMAGVTDNQKLSTYRAKRNFAITAEPSGAAEISPANRRRFVIQKHDATRLLELDGAFKSWAVTKGPSLDPRDKRLAIEVEDHPLDYGDFEGTIPKGEYGGGTVQLWDRGYWEPEGNKTPEAGLASGDLKFSLEGKRLLGSWVLVRMKHDRMRGKLTNWLLINHRDSYAQEGDGDAILEEGTNKWLPKGRGPKPFMLGGKSAADPDAVWDSSQGFAAERRAGNAALIAR